MSHAGPYCDTSIAKSFLRTDYEGSRVWNELIDEFQDSIIMHLHGHTHRGHKTD